MIYIIPLAHFVKSNSSGTIFSFQKKILTWNKKAIDRQIIVIHQKLDGYIVSK